MKSKILIYVSNPEYIGDYKALGVSAFLFALEDYCVGYETLPIEEIKKIDVSNKYILLNRILDCNDIDYLEEIISSFEGIKGLVFEDVGVYQMVKEKNLSFELILFQNHFATNINSVSFWLNRVDSILLGNELTLEEIESISRSVPKKVCLHLFGYNQVMYSKRRLLTNWSEEFSIPYESQNLLEDRATHVRFRVYENKHGTVMYSDKIYNGNVLFNNKSIYYYYVNPMLIEHETIKDFLRNIKNYENENCDTGFLYKETIYKLK